MINCFTCNKPTKNPKFCSRSCVAKTNNTLFPKKIPKGKCKNCSTNIITSKKYCSNCRKAVDYLRGNITLQEAIYVRLHKSSAFALVRTRARAVMRKFGINKCQNCGYDKHTEVAHKNKISSYPLNTMLSEINNPNNLLVLCRNCHWEFDHQQ